MGRFQLGSNGSRQSLAIINRRRRVPSFLLIFEQCRDRKPETGNQVAAVEILAELKNLNLRRRCIDSALQYFGLDPAGLTRHPPNRGARLLVPRTARLSL